MPLRLLGILLLAQGEPCQCQPCRELRDLFSSVATALGLSLLPLKSQGGQSATQPPPS